MPRRISLLERVARVVCQLLLKVILELYLLTSELSGSIAIKVWDHESTFPWDDIPAILVVKPSFISGVSLHWHGLEGISHSVIKYNLLIILAIFRGVDCKSDDDLFPIVMD
jgi:hypothetical protein